MREEKFHGLDTETPLGSIRVLATEEEAVEVETFEDILGFLGQRKHLSKVFFTFNLQFDAEAILKSTGDLDFLTELYFTGAAPKGIEYSEEVKVRYIPKKFLRICFNRGSENKRFSCVSIYDIAQFYGGWSLDKASGKFLGDYKNPISGERIGSEEGYYESHKAEVMEYCRKDADLTLRLSMLMKKTIESVEMPKGQLTFRNPISQAKISENYVKQHFKPYPTVPKAIDFYHWLSQEAYHGGIFSTVRRGFFDKKLYSYDINSAYPFQMHNLPHWANGEFKNVEKPDEYDTRYGWFLCKFDCPYISYADAKHPYTVEFCYRGVKPDQCEDTMINPKRIVYPSGERSQWITKIEYEWMLKHNYVCKFITGFVWVQTKDEYTAPFVWLEEVYKARRRIKAEDKEDIRQWALKIVMNGIYGKTAQKRKGIGALTNFFYASYITAGTRLQISEAGVIKPDHVIEYATDSILLDAPLDLTISDNLGDWSEDVYSRGLIVGSGIRQQWAKTSHLKPETFITHARGLTYKNDWDMEADMQKNRKRNKLYFEKTRPIHLGEMIFHHKILSLKDLCVFVRTFKRLDVNTDKKRRWEREYKDFGDILSSDPMRSEPLTYEEVTR